MKNSGIAIFGIWIATALGVVFGGLGVEAFLFALMGTFVVGLFFE